MAPTDRYPHGILGHVQGWGSLIVDVRLCPACGASSARLRIDLPETRVFEDLAPRLWDVTGHDRPEVVAVEGDMEQGAWLVVEAKSDASGQGATLRLLAARPFIGTRFRWLAPAGAADVTGDGVAEIAYVETSHRSRILRLVTLSGDELGEIAHLEGVTNHAVGEERLLGDTPISDGRPDVDVLPADQAAVLALRYEEVGCSPASWVRPRDRRSHPQR